MSHFQTNDKVVCIDGDPRPFYLAGGASLSDITLPDGLVSEGTIYCVRALDDQRPDGQLGLFIVGKRVFFRGREVAWHHARFRKVERNEACRREMAEELV